MYTTEKLFEHQSELNISKGLIVPLLSSNYSFPSFFEVKGKQAAMVLWFRKEHHTQSGLGMSRERLHGQCRKHVLICEVPDPSTSLRIHCQRYFPGSVLSLYQRMQDQIFPTQDKSQLFVFIEKL